MKKLWKAIKGIKNRVKQFWNTIKTAGYRAKFAVANRRGESSVSTAVTILTAVVLGALILVGLYALLKDQVLPTLADKIEELFDYAD
ncbi:MAG: DUF6133 family protein [Eubacteriales bacterium]|nr:DUF6133 family protein [Eubacteriales bacterium]